MNIQILHIPDDTSEQDIHGLLDRYADVREVSICFSIYDELHCSFVELEESPVVSHLVARKLDGMYWKGHSLEARVMLFSRHD